MRDTRKNLNLTTAETAAMQQHAAELGVSVSSLGREWFIDFIENGSDYVKPTLQRVQVLAESEILTQAETIAARDYDATLTDIIRRKIQLLRE